MKPIAHITTDFPTKFGIPRQSGLSDELCGAIVFQEEYRSRESLVGLDGFSHLWLLWQFSESEGWHPTVRPPRLGGNKRVGVFASRSPFRPNPIGLSCVKLVRIDYECANAPVIYVSGIDMKDGTPIYDIKPYLPLTDCRTDASGGYADTVKDYKLNVVFPDTLLALLPEDKRDGALFVLSHDPRPSYQNDVDRRYGVQYAGYDIHFTVGDGVLTVVDLIPVN